MSNPTKKAKVLKSGKEITVYRHFLRGTWIDYSDCKTEYKTEEIEILN